MTLINNQTNKPCLSDPSQSSSCFSLELLYFITLHSILSHISFSFWKSLWFSICCSLIWTVFSPLSLKMANSYTPNSAKERMEDIKSYIYWTLPRVKCSYHGMTLSTLNGTLLIYISLVRKLGTKEARNKNRSIWPTPNLESKKSHQTATWHSRLFPHPSKGHLQHFQGLKQDEGSTT